MPQPKIDIPMEQIAAFCRKWQITEFALFGSVLRDDFRPDSDVDVLVTFAPEARWGLFELFDMRDELADLFQRSVDVVTRWSIEHAENPFRKEHILQTSEVIYAAA